MVLSFNYLLNCIFYLQLNSRSIYSVLLKVKVDKKQKLDFELIDTGGQRTERRKWIHAFEDVTAGENQKKDNLDPDWLFIFQFCI